MPYHKISTTLKIATIIFISSLLFSCNEKDDDNEIYAGEKTALPTPSNFMTDSDNKRISWDKVENAESYSWVIGIFNYGSVSHNYIDLNSIENDQWMTITVQAIAPVNTQWENSASASYSFIFTDKTLLDTPTNFQYKMLDNSTVTVTWNAVANAVKYDVTFERINNDILLKENRTVTETSFTAKLSSVSGYSYYIYVRAIPETGNATYVSSKLGAAQIPIEQ